MNDYLPLCLLFTYRDPPAEAEAEDCVMMNQDCWLVEPASYQIVVLYVVV